MAKRWAASTLLETEKSFRKIMGFKDIWRSTFHKEQVSIIYEKNPAKL